ncbi:glycosyltransferase family 39 protein [Robiginitalea sp. SC105]|uniref:ArnT family glycosyltransferase n=1 Tax=Robiginitalea sp. SC105 TaxID=2762332 RepID=UPI00163A8067|nr:glycosyltransferase family 39 protein [Robiginitalea sp. SC105]MBC2837910.1 glycosyltransferase family 39 protein [Robiginitalea sp. SC105]
MNQRFPRILLALVGCLLLLNLVQAAFTELLYDEAYYWYYAKDLSWGYFDHPPMVAWMIGLGSALFEGELGVRLISALLGTATVALIWILIDNPDRNKYPVSLFLWITSITLLHAYGFLSLPDTPLLFFTALFLLAYRHFLQKPGIPAALLLGIVMAALMYSKYHAALVILFVLLSNLRLLRSGHAWLALCVSLVCYLPHLAWLYQQEFISVRYHLFERPNQPYSFTKFTAGYFLNLIALFGLTFPWVYKSLWQYRTADPFRRALKYVAWGILLFFFVSSFQRRVQTQWLIAACIPMAVLVGETLLNRPQIRKWVVRASMANVVILLFLRVGLVYEPLFPVPFEAHGNKAWVSSLQQTAGGAPVVFENSYRQASMYQFYSGAPSFSLNNAWYRKNQYSIDDSESIVQGKRVFFIPVVDMESTDYYLDQSGKKKYGWFIDQFTSYRKLRAGTRPENSYPSGEEGTFWLYNPYQKPVPLQDLKFGIVIMDGYKETQRVIQVRPGTGEVLPGDLSPADSLQFRFRFPETGERPVYIRAAVTVPGLIFGLNGNTQKISE